VPVHKSITLQMNLRGGAMVGNSAELLIGIDLGSTQVKLAIRAADGELIYTACMPSRGRHLATLYQALIQIPQAEQTNKTIHVVVTGSGKDLLGGTGQHILVNEVVATALAARNLPGRPRTIIDLGGEFSKLILLDPDRDQEAGVVDFATNGLCAAGAGAFLEQQAGRLGLTVDAMGQMAFAAKRGASIAGRCSVFAKSDMIHLQQKGTPPAEIALGLCQAMVRNFITTVIQKRKFEPPVMLVGGGAMNAGLVRAFRELLALNPNQLFVPTNPLFIGASGAARMAADAPSTRWEEFLETIKSQSVVKTHPLDPPALLPLLGSSSNGEKQPEEDPPAIDGEVQAYLGVDVGSVSTNLVLLSPDFKVLQGIYLPTSGRPIEALDQGLHCIQERFAQRLQLLGVGATGSGRHLAAKLLGTDVIHNEITAQMVSATTFVPEADTIFEIGGQDSKYILVRNGHLADFEMNKICAGGTGSFLEEQAQRLGVQIIGEFARLALSAENPCNLGSRCTVFMDSELVRAQEQGLPLEDICAGLSYAVARNYLERLVAGRPIGNCIILQGGTASNTAVVAAFRRLLNRPIHVHPYNRISGAIGAAILAARAQPHQSRFLGFQSCSNVKLHSFECQRCENRCQVNRVSSGSRIVHFGDTCERYSERDGETRQITRPFPELFGERERLMESLLTPASNPAQESSRIGLLRASLNLEFLPFWTTFLTDLNYAVVVSGRTTPAMIHEFAAGVPAEVCLPIKSAAAHARALLAKGDVEKIFIPALLECPPRGKDDPSHCCFYEQQLADMMKSELGPHLVSAQFILQEGILSLFEPVLALAQSLERSPEVVLRALVKARDIQVRFASALTSLGEKTLSSHFDRAVVVLGRPYNTYDPCLNLCLASHLEQLGLPAIPWDMLPLKNFHLEARWENVPWYYNREQLRAIELIRQDERLFPILVSSYGCGLDAFMNKHAEELLANRPRLLLEFDEHRGEAGLITRLEAFADEIGEYLVKRGKKPSSARLTPGPQTLPRGSRFFISNFSEHAHVFAATLRSIGCQAEVLPPPNTETIRLGEEYSSGRECHPYSIIVGELLRFLQRDGSRSGAVFFFPSCRAPCLLRQYGDGMRILLDRLGLDGVKIWDPTSSGLWELLGLPGINRLYEGLLSTDILSVLSVRLRPYEEEAGTTDHVMAECLQQVTRTLAGKEKLGPVFANLVDSLWNIPRTGQPCSRPVVGITGDFYTRTNSAGNAGLFRRLEQMGCEVWPSPFFAATLDLGSLLEFYREAGRGRLKEAATEGLARALARRARNHLLKQIPDEILKLAVEPPVEELFEQSRSYVGPRTNHLIVNCVAKVADFLQRGASGVINACGINCMVGTATSGVLPSIRANFRGTPVITLHYGGAEGPSQRICLETFVHQVKQHWRRYAA
jgi:predicted CoA-substrate-specific enzyme activase